MIYKPKISMSIIKKFNKLFKYLLFLLFAAILIDLIINLIIPEKIKKQIGTTKNYSLKSKKFHHELASNINLSEFWGEKKYQVITNDLGMRINENYEINKKKRNIGFMGDSFVYGSGIDYSNHFINFILKQNNSYNLLNLAYVGYSPSIYLKKLEYYIQKKKINFKTIYLFIDTSDIQDEAIFYREDKYGNIVRKWNSDKKNQIQNLKYTFKNYLKQNSFIFKFYDIVSSKSVQGNQLKCLNTTGKIENFIEFLDYERFGYGTDFQIQKKDWVKKGQLKTLNYLSKIKKLLDDNKIKLVLVYYPSAIDILKGKKNFNKNSHFQILNKWSMENNVEFLNTSDDFNSNSSSLNNYINNHIKCDIHWNINGHKIIAQNILLTLN